MKKLAALAAALICAALMTVCAGARSVLDYEWEYDDYNDCYYLYDPDTWELAGIEYSDGRVVWFDDYEYPDETVEEYFETAEPDVPDPEPEPQPPYVEPDPVTEESGQELQQYLVDTMFLPAPTLSVEELKSTSVTLRSDIPAGWKPDGCVIECLDSRYNRWEVIDDIWINAEYDTECWFEDIYAEPDCSYTYRFSFYKYFDWEQVTVTTAEISVTTPPDYFLPRYEGGEVTDTTARLNITVDRRWDPAKCVVKRRTSPDAAWKKLTSISEYTIDENGDNTAVYTYSTTKLKQKSQYFYRFEVYTADGSLIGAVEFDITTLETPEEPKLLEPVAHSDSVTLTAVVDERWNADGFEVYRYNNRTKKWTKLSESEHFSYYDWNSDVDFYSATYTDTGLKSATQYKYMVKLYRDVNGKRDYFSKLKTTVYTLLPAPKLTLGATSKKATLNWSKVSGAAGYEVWVLPVDESDDWSGWYYYDYYWYDSGAGYTTTPQYDASLSRYNQSYRSSTLRSMSISDFTKKSTIKNGGTTTASFTVKSGKAYVYIVRAYKKSGNTKIYGEYSNQETTDSTSALLNGLTLKSQVTVNEYDLGLIKSALKKCVNNKMTNAEKAAAVYDYVHNAAIYEYDYSKIPYDSIEAILSAGRGQCYQYAVTYQAIMKYLGFDVKLVSGKTSSGGPHWWCELTCAGTTYMIDPQVGGRFLIRYDRMGGYAVTREKVYD